MEVDELQNYLKSKTSTPEEQPFGPQVLVYKVKGKMFATLGFDEGLGRTNLKCDPEKSLDLRDRYESIIPGYHMNKKHWNTLILDGSLPAKLICKLVDHSYELVVAKLPKKDREDLA